MMFEKSVHVALWGSECWEISAHSTDPSVIADGDEKECRLNEINLNFPLLFKVIDAKTRLSVQVHPNEETCKVTGVEPKTEMWCALSDGAIYAGLKKGTSAADVEVVVKSGRFEELLVRHEVKFGDVFFMPGGLVRAIGDGVKLYEVQQSSNTTFRLYDWGVSVRTASRASSTSRRTYRRLTTPCPFPSRANRSCEWLFHINLDPK